MLPRAGQGGASAAPIAKRSFRPRFYGPEDRLRQHGADHEHAGVDDLGDLQVDDQRAQQVRVLARQPVVAVRWSIIARVAFWAFSNRSPPTPVVANQEPWSTAGVSEPGAVRYCGDGIERFSTLKRIVAYIGASSPVTQISPSPWQQCASPV